MDLTPAQVAAAADRQLADLIKALTKLRAQAPAAAVTQCPSLLDQSRHALYRYRGAQMLLDLHQRGLDQAKYARHLGIHVNKVREAIRAAKDAAASAAPADTAPANVTSPDATLAQASGEQPASGGPDAAPGSPDSIVAHLRATDTEADGSAFLDAQRLDRDGLLAVAAAAGLTRVNRLSLAALQAKVIHQTITARKKYVGLRKW